ncbi:LLM class flavin-dependent oxidoreductase [Amycolatopsis anabasis]|uniref:LLM class flavin-dependent oxidoreductase n=1 Tax=Amycolatopsis anabasis TaxID=1840409 RepID=UPI00131CD017|nr:LLM class flavin-dependent oxidoreductase [Amycolatopsis anabasis]
MLEPAKPMRFHWSVPGTGAADATRGAQDRRDIDPMADLDAQLELCRLADRGGIDQLLLPIGFHRADPITLATHFATATRRVRFMVAVRPGIISPTYLVQQVNTVSTLTGGRVAINVVAGYSSQELRSYGDFRSHDDRFGYSDEFWTVCRALWNGEDPVDFHGRYLRVEGARVKVPFAAGARRGPELFFGGSSELAAGLAVKHGDALLRIGGTPEEIAPRIQPVLAAGREAGLLFSIIARPSRDEAIEAGRALIESAGARARRVQDRFRKESAESIGFTTTYTLGAGAADWPKPYLWLGAIPFLGPNALALVGTPDGITDALFEYRRIGVTQFLFHGRPDIESLPYFCAEILPRVREREQAMASL